MNNNFKSSMTFSRIPFEKYHGLGNDFIFISHRQLVKFTTLSELRTFVINICQRRLSVGADGVVFFRSLKSSKRVEILIINSDGSFAATCGNALRCLGLKLFRENLWNGQKSLHVFRLSFSQSFKKQSELLEVDEKFVLETKKSFATLSKLTAHTLTQHNRNCKINNSKQYQENSAIVDVVFEPTKNISYWNIKKDLKFDFISHTDFHAPPVFVELENPHLVFFSSKFKNLNTQEFCEFGKHIQKLMNVNVSMVTVPDAFYSTRSNQAHIQTTKSDVATSFPMHMFTLHVYERGAGLTQACGSGSVATALALKFAGIVQTLETPVALHMPGGSITVFQSNNELILSGLSAYSFNGYALI